MDFERLTDLLGSAAKNIAELNKVVTHYAEVFSDVLDVLQEKLEDVVDAVEETAPVEDEPVTKTVETLEDKYNWLVENTRGGNTLAQPHVKAFIMDPDNASLLEEAYEAAVNSTSDTQPVWEENEPVVKAWDSLR